MNKGKIGIQFSTLKPAVKELGLYETLKKSAELGYHCIEISQTPMTRENIEIFKRARDEFGMEVAALTAKVEGGMAGQDCLVNDYDKVVSDCHELGAHLLRIGMGPIYTMNTMEDALAYCDSVRPYVERLKADGIDYYYHNHSLEFRKFDGKYLLDIIREKSGLGFEIDIHWVQVGGRDPVQLLKEYAGSIKLVHLKDYRIVPCKKDMRELFRRVSIPSLLQYSSPKSARAIWTSRAASRPASPAVRNTSSSKWTPPMTSHPLNL